MFSPACPARQKLRRLRTTPRTTLETRTFKPRPLSPLARYEVRGHRLRRTDAFPRIRAGSHFGGRSQSHGHGRRDSRERADKSSPRWSPGCRRIPLHALSNVESRPFFAGEFTTQGYGTKFYVLQANIGYTKVGKAGSVIVRAGQMTSSFGSFLLRYDDADNPLLGMPMQYGYYYAGVTTAGLAGAQIDATHGRWDCRLQFTNSSPTNPRSIFAKDQYGNWAGGIGYTIRQGLRVGVSGYRGPYLDRKFAFFVPGESKPRDLPASAGGLDIEWAQGHWNVYGEWQHFLMTYHLIPAFREDAGYVEVKRVLHPRWYVAGRAGYLHESYNTGGETYEATIGYRPNARQLVK